MYLLYVKKGRILKQNVYVKYLKKTTTKACIVYNSLFLLKFQFAAERANSPLLKSVRLFSRAMQALLRWAGMRRAEFLIYQPCMYIVTMLLHLLRFFFIFYVSSSTINVSNRMYMFNPFYSTVNPLRMCSLVLCVVDIVPMSN